MLYPDYLRDINPEAQTFGTLHYNRRSKCWTIKGEPYVLELVKRVLPQCDTHVRGEARFAPNRRIIGELNWLMQRYPLTVRPADRERWEEALDQAREYALRRMQARELPEYSKPPEGTFAGELLPYQQQGLSFLLASRRCLLADEMGLGKTVQGLAFLAATAAYPCIVVAPAHLVRNWMSETARFLGRDVRIHVIHGLKPYALPEADVYIVHYLLLRGWKEVLPYCGIRTVIFDEIQELRHSGTNKYSAASLLSERCENAIGLSGTPIYNQGGEIWNVINIIDFQCLGSWEGFTREWCNGYNTSLVVKPDVLGEHLKREGLMLRRNKSQVLTELAPKRRLVQEIDWDDEVYRALMKPVAQSLEALRRTADPSMRAVIEDAISQQERQATGLAKAPFVATFVRALLQDGARVLLMAHHHAVMDAYKKELAAFKPGFVTGRETQGQKQAAVDAFMDGKTNLLCVSLRSASGLNLQRANVVVFGELDWSPAVHSQAEDRAHRIGQRDSLLCYYLVSPRGSDRDMQDALGLKVSQFVSLMGDEVQSQEDVLSAQARAREYIKRIVERLEEENGI